MLTRAACFILVVSLGLSACTNPISNHPKENLSPTTTTDISHGTDLPSEFPLPGVSSESPTEMSEEIEVPIDQATPTTSHTIEIINDSTAAMPPYRLQVGTPRLMANFIQPEAGCNWMGVGGQAFSLSGQPVTTLVVEVGGKLAGEDVFHLELTGNLTNLGPGGYLVTLSNRPIASIGTLWVLLYDLAGLPLTDKIYFSTTQDCANNFVLINFVEANPNTVPQAWLPMIGK